MCMGKPSRSTRSDPMDKKREDERGHIVHRDESNDARDGKGNVIAKLIFGEIEEIGRQQRNWGSTQKQKKEKRVGRSKG